MPSLDPPAVPDKPILADQSVLLIRLPAALTPDVVQHRAEQRIGRPCAPILSWAWGAWFLVPQGCEAMLAPTGAPDTLMREFGAAETRRMSFTDYARHCGAREAQPPAALARDAGSTGLGRPSLVGRLLNHAGRQLAFDWQLTVTGIPGAWALFDPTPGQLPWADIPVAHLDTGCTRHWALGFHDGLSDYLRPDLGLNLFATLPAPGDGGTAPGAPTEESGPYDNLTGPNGGHGTRTQSVLCGYYDTGDLTLDVPFFGAAPGARLVPYRITDSILIDRVQGLMVDAIDHAVAQGCRVLSMSLGGVVPYGRLAAALDRAYEAGVIVCAAAGNVIREVTYPGRYNRVLTVGGVAPAGAGFAPWDGAARGPFVDVCGPAASIRRASARRRRGRLEYFVAGNGDGTSYATALCAGLAVLWLAYRRAQLETAYGPPDWTWPAAFKRLIKESAETPAGWDSANWGRGLYRADRLLAAPLPPVSTLHREAPAGAPFDPLA